MARGLILALWLPLEPVAKGRPRLGRGRTYTPEKTRRFEATVKAALLRYSRACGLSNPIEGAVSVDLEFRLKKPKRSKRDEPIVKPDIDNYIKAILDACNQVVWVDDGQVIELVASKRYADARGPGIALSVYGEAINANNHRPH